MSNELKKSPKRPETDTESLEESIEQVEDLGTVLKKSIDIRTVFMICLAFFWMIIFFAFAPGGIEGILETLFQIKIEFLVLGLMITLLGLFLDAISWRILLRRMDVFASINDTLEAYFVSFAWGLLIPSLTAAEIYVRISLGKKRFLHNPQNRSPSAGELFSTIVLHKLLGFLAFLPLSVPFAYGLVVLLDLDPTIGLYFMAFIAILTALVILFLALIYAKPNIATGFLTRGISVVATLIPPYRSKVDSHKAAARQFVLDYRTNFRFLASHPLAAFKAYLFALSNALCGFIGATFIVYSLGANVPIWAILVIVFVSGSINLIPLGIPGMEGFKETVIASLYDKYENFSTAGAIGILNSINTFYVPVLVGLLFAVLGNRKKDRKTFENQKTEIKQSLESSQKSGTNNEYRTSHET
ncbi:MAG: lysylphosphatidylglycerol synthase transmembrane domain-containing protein [Candidatus Hodarchaeales archaeon]